MKELRITIIHDGSNTVKEFQGEEMVKNATIYLANLAGLFVFEKTNQPAINIPDVTPEEFIKEVEEGIDRISKIEVIETPVKKKPKGTFSKLKNILK